ncbi:MAG TPA: hypothetical protein VHR97_01350 [Candidatus Baltobacteraceae bacterium]|nr:hypothetical protein [Candidatus Baltobacteraceae bacterium]
MSVASALLAGCGGLASPIAAPGAMPQASAIAKHAAGRKSWMLPEAQNEDLLYIADPGTGGVIVYTYEPPRYKFVGFLADATAPLGECVDKAQQIFVTNSGGFNGGAVTFVYEHGGVNPIRILGDPAGLPASCSVDATSGDLAVAGGYSGPAQLALYAKQKGRPKIIPAPDFGYIAFCAYDDNGNLFVDGLNANRRHFILEELPPGSSTFVAIKVRNAINPIGGIQWDGKHLAVGDSYNGTVYRFKIHGHIAEDIGSTPLNGVTSIDQFFITGSRIIDPSGPIDERSGWVNFYPYPSGGDPGRNLPNFSAPYGVVVSRAAK